MSAIQVNIANGTANLKTIADSNGANAIVHAVTDSSANVITPAQDVTVQSIVTKLGNTLTTQGTPDQDPIYDHINGVKVTVTTNSTIVMTPPANCKYVRFTADTSVVVRTDGIDAADDGHSVGPITDDILPVTPGIVVKALCISGTSATVRAIPYKSRS